TLYGMEHGSDHHMIKTVFDILVPMPKPQERLLLKNAPWKEINARITRSLSPPSEGTVQQKTDTLMTTVLEVVHSLTPKAKPSPYTKRWWTSDLMQLHHIYNCWRNHAQAEQHSGQSTSDLEE